MSRGALLESETVMQEATLAALAGQPLPRVRTRHTKRYIGKSKPREHYRCDVRIENPKLRRQAAAAIEQAVLDLGGTIISSNTNRSERRGTRLIERFVLPKGTPTSRVAAITHAVVGAITS